MLGKDQQILQYAVFLLCGLRQHTSSSNMGKGETQLPDIYRFELSVKSQPPSWRQWFTWNPLLELGKKPDPFGSKRCRIHVHYVPGVLCGLEVCVLQHQHQLLQGKDAILSAILSI